MYATTLLGALEPRSPRRAWLGPAVIAATLVLVDLVTHGPLALPSPWDAGLFLAALAVVVYAGFTGNGPSLAVSVVLYALYTPRFSAEVGGYDTSPDGLMGAVIVAFIAAPVGVTAMWMRKRQDEANERVRRAEEERSRILSAANESLQSFTYVVSHDLKEPLRALEILLQALDEDERRNLSADGRDILDQARGASGRLRALTESLLEFSRAAHGDLGSRTSVRLDDALAEPACRTRYENVAKERAARIRTEGTHHAVLATVPSLCQILGNLVLNAIKHNPRPEPTITVAARAVEGARVEIRVDDDGPGFPPEVLESFRGHDRVSRGGFGLTIARRAAERLGGTFEILNRPEGGARVLVTLPAGSET